MSLQDHIALTGSLCGIARTDNEQPLPELVQHIEDFAKPSKENCEHCTISADYCKLRLTGTKPMRLNVCTTKTSGYIVTTVKRDFLLSKIWATCDQFSRIGALMTPKDKARNSTNNGGRLVSVVESMHRLSSACALFLTHYGVMKS